MNLDDVEKARHRLNQIARIDRLPQENTLEALYILQRAWDEVDVCSSTARGCKIAAKTIYTILLLLSLATTSVTTLWLNLPPAALSDADPDAARPELPGDLQYLDAIIIVLTILTTTLVSVLAFFNPMAKWRNLRGGIQQSIALLLISMTPNTHTGIQC